MRILTGFALVHSILPFVLLLLGSEWWNSGIENKGNEIVQLGTFIEIVVLRVFEGSPPYGIMLFAIAFAAGDLAIVYGLMTCRVWVRSLVSFWLVILTVASVVSLSWALFILYDLEVRVRVMYGLPPLSYIGELVYSTELRATFFWGVIGLASGPLLFRYLSSPVSRKNLP